MLQCSLNELLDTEVDIQISGITHDSREVQQGYLFVACPGEKSDGRKFVDAAIQQGAAAIVYEAIDAGTLPAKNSPIPLIPLEHLTQYQSEMAARFYGHPSRQMMMIGVTGTNGKTSTTQFIAQALTRLGQNCGVIGTIGYGLYPQLLKSTHTTPDAITVQKMLYDLQQQGATTTAMEVSSHSLVQHRVAAVQFDIAVFTNLTRDHLDYHGDMSTYAKAKERLFQFPGLKHAVINLDDEMGQRLVHDYAEKLSIVTYSQQGNKNADIYLTSHTPTDHGFQLNIYTPRGATSLALPLLGDFNISNVLAVLGVLLILKIPLEAAINVLAQLHPVLGRMQVLGGGSQPTVIIDYAHTPDALQQALTALREHCRGKLWCIFGCGGDRDKGKRPEMGAIAERLSDWVVLTNDNPRSEVPKQILADIKAGMQTPVQVIEELDRAKAIHYVIQHAELDDVILIAGKGHEDYQILGTKTLPFSDSQVVIQQLQLLK